MKKRILSIVLAICLVLSCVPVTVFAAQHITPSEPQRDSNDVYQIGTKEELYWFADKVNNDNANYGSASAVLTADIVVNKDVLKDNGTIADDTSTFTSWTPIGNFDNQYTGTFDGQGHTISGLYFNDTSKDDVGLFGYLGSGGKIKNVGVIDSYFNGFNYVGGVCGLNNNIGTITGCYNAGTVSGSGNYVGGVCGKNAGNATIITGCYNTGTVSGNNYVGGVCGENYKGTITGCYNAGTVSGNNYVGGVCGYNSGNATIITGCYNTGTVSGNNLVGGVCGKNNKGTITGCYTNRARDTYYKSDTEFADGTVCTLLNTALQSKNYGERFCQRIGTDASPLFDYQIDEHTYGVYTVDNNTFKVTCLCGAKDTKTMELTLTTEKTVVAKGEKNTLTAELSNYENEAVTYQWYQNDTLIENATSSTYKMPTGLEFGTYTYKVQATIAGAGAITKSVSVYVDNDPPTGEISVGTNKWNGFLNTITFGLFFKDTQTVTITASDNSGEDVTIEYLLSDKELDETELASATFTAYTEVFSINPGNKYVIYAKLTDTSGNVAYINSEGIVLDSIAPVISGVENGKTYCEAQTVTVTEEYIESVKVNGTEVTLDANNQFTLNPAEGTQTIVATDNAGNKKEMTVTVNNGHTYSEWQSKGNGTHTRYCTVTGCDGYEDGDCEGGQASYFKKAVCKTCNEEYGSLLTDTTAPTGEITVGTNKWSDFLNTITFGLFFKDTQSVTITATDDSYSHEGYTDDKAVKVEYYLYSGDTALTKADLAGVSFTAYNNTFSINPDNNYVVYARLTDHAGNVTYISSNGIVLDATAPEITGVTDGAVYYTTQKAVVTDDNLKSVTLNGVSIDGTTVTLDGNTDEVYTIVATDKSDNSTTVTVTMKPISSLAQSIEDVNDENVKSSNKEEIDAVKESVGEVDTSNATDSEKEALNDIDERCDELLDIIDKAQKATQTENIKNVEGINPDNVTKNDREALEKAKADLEKALEDNGSNYTDDEKAKTQSDLERIDESLKVLDDVKAVEDSIASLPDTFKPDDLDTVQKIQDAKKSYDALTDYEKSLVSKDAKEKLDTLIKGITAYAFYEGSGGIWTISQYGALTFTANGAYSKFTGIKIDGKDVDKSNYTAKSGSTIITLNAAYLNTLSVGTHKLTVLYTDGEAKAEFEVKEAPKDTEETTTSKEPVNTEETTKPEETANTEETATQKETANTTETTKSNENTSKKSPETGNEGATALLLAFLLSCGGAIVVTSSYGKRKKHSTK